ncbi:MAG: cation:proton antiporter [Gemmatimonadaceae bacterium]|nr:cation:proton antiporter [Gloeobacterales cyanobacterium ES-bin-141]
MNFNLIFVVIGALFISMALAGSVLKRLPLSTSILYLLVGVLLGPFGLGLIRIDPIEQAKLLERVTEVAVLVSLFTAGLKLRPLLSVGQWSLPVRLAFVSMSITVGAITLAGMVGLNLPLGAAILLGAILAPTDPVLASDVQVVDPGDRDGLRLGLTGEAALNDGTAFPFVMLGLGLLGLHELGENGWRWVGVDVVWATTGGLGIGAALGTLVGQLVLYLRREHKEAVGLDDFLALGLVALSYGVALLVSCYGFLAVFAAGLALRRIEAQSSEGNSFEEVEAMTSTAEAEVEEIATDPDKASAYMAEAVLEFNEQLERIGEVAVVVLLGAMLSARYFTFEVIWFAPLLFLIIRPIGVWVGLIGSRTAPSQLGLMSWFGIRGIGSIYYLMYAIAHGLDPELARDLTAITFCTVAFSIVVHGISVTPLMNLYADKGPSREKEA